MQKMVSFIPVRVAADGSKTWGLGPEENTLQVWRAGDFLANKDAAAERNSTHTVSGLADWQLKKIARYVDQNIDKRLRVSDMGLQVRLSTSRFSKGFKVSVGLSPYDYVLHKRIEFAKQLIGSTLEPLSQIATACGLSDQAHLSKVFKRLVGVTPLNWRRIAQARSSGQAFHTANIVRVPQAAAFAMGA